MTFKEKLEKVINNTSTEELEFAGGNGMELNEYIASREFKQEMQEIQGTVPMGRVGQTGY